MRTKEEYYEDTLKTGPCWRARRCWTAVVLTDAANGTGSAANV